jgi:hypothetical protein
MSYERFYWQIAMAQKYDGVFSSGLFSLQLQLKNLLEGAGGDHALRFLDTLCQMSASEQEIALDVFTRALKRITSGEPRLFTEGDLALKEFEDTLYNDIVHAMKAAASNDNEKPQEQKKLSVVNGGKSRPVVEVRKVEESHPIDFEKARRSRKSRSPHLVN